MKNVSLITLAMVLLSSCNPRVTSTVTNNYPVLDYKEEVIILGVNEKSPDGEFIGTLKIGDSGFSTKCSWEVVVEYARLEARKMGGNVVKIETHTPPDLFSSCHRISASVLKVDNTSALNEKKEDENTLGDVDYALLHVYRPGSYGALINYDLYLGDSVITRVKANSKTTVVTKKEGMNTIWAKTESKTEVPIDITLGHEYYIRCGVNMGILMGRPDIELVDLTTAEVEFESLKNSEKGSDIIEMNNGDRIQCLITGEDLEKVYIKMQVKGEWVETFVNKSNIEKIYDF